MSFAWLVDKANIFPDGTGNRQDRETEVNQNGRNVVCITGFYVVVLDDYDRKTGYVTARYLYDFEGTEVDPNGELEAGRLSAIALVK